MQGANLRFAGKDVFLKSHGFDHLYGSEELKSVVADPHYRNDWGFYDDTVLDAILTVYPDSRYPSPGWFYLAYL